MKLFQKRLHYVLSRKLTGPLWVGFRFLIGEKCFEWKLLIELLW